MKSPFRLLIAMLLLLSALAAYASDDMQIYSGGFVTGIQFQFNWPADRTGWQLQSQTNGAVFFRLMYS